MISSNDAYHRVGFGLVVSVPSFMVRSPCRILREGIPRRAKKLVEQIMQASGLKGISAGS